jgi:hypothetical protein
MAWTDPLIQIYAYKSDSDINTMLEMISDSMARYVVFPPFDYQRSIDARK